MQTGEAQARSAETTMNDSAAAQPAGCPMSVEPRKQHEWLTRLVGEWSCEGEAMMGPAQPPIKWQSTEIVRSLGGLWIVAEGTGEMPGGGVAQTILTIGYDPQKDRYVGTFVASMMANLWVYEGRLDEANNVLPLHTEGPEMSAERTIRQFKDVIEPKSDDYREMNSYMQTEGGEWVPVMRITYRRK